MLGFGSGPGIDTLFEQDGAVNADDRYHLLDLYSGFGSTGAGGGGPATSASSNSSIAVSLGISL